MAQETTQRQTATDLSEDYGAIDIRTTDNGTVWARCTDIYSHQPESDEIHIEADLPNGDTVKETMDKPTTWDTRHKFVRIIEHQGYDASSIEHLIGEQIEVEHYNDEWQFVDPTAIGDPWTKFKKAKLQLLALIGWGITAWLAWQTLGTPINYGAVAVAALTAYSVLQT